MQVKVVKFGGSSLASAAQFRKVASIILSDPSRKYVVASAPGKRSDDDIKVTDMLYECYKLAAKRESIDEAFSKIEKRFQDIIDELGIELSLAKEFSGIKEAILHHVGRDYLASRGEYLNSIVLAKYLGFDFIDAAEGILFKEDGTFDADLTDTMLAEVLQGHEYAVIPGFYGSMPNGTIKTFSRGGSDITGSIVARTVHADLYENWTDVSGMLMADPRCVENPLPIDLITYQELRELAYMGASVMHEDAIFPVREACIPINIRNTNRPEDPGTMIVAYTNAKATDRIITGVSGKKGFTSISIEKEKMTADHSFGIRVLSVLERHHVGFEHYLAGIDTMSVIVKSEQIHEIKDLITGELFSSVAPDNISLQEGLALVAIVGRGMVKAKGTAGRIFKALANASINIRMIDQGASELSIMVGVDEKDFIPALKAIYYEFVPTEETIKMKKAIAGSATVAEEKFMGYPRVCAHRGFSVLAPENTMPAFGAAVAMGAEEIEFDLWPTTDGEIVSCHDRTLDRVSNGTGLLTDHTLEELKALDFGSKFGEKFAGLPIVTLEEILRKFAGQVIMNIHVKPLSMTEPYPEETMKTIVNLVRKYRADKHAYFMLETDLQIAQFKKYAPDIPVCVGHLSERPWAIVDRAIQFGCEKVQLFKPYFNQDMINKAHANGILCNVFWSDDPAETKEFLAMGIDTILTNDYNLISQQVER